MTDVYSAREVAMWGGGHEWWVERNGYKFIAVNWTNVKLTERQANAIAAALNAAERSTEEGTQ